VEANLQLAERVLNGEPGAPRDVILLNAGVGMVVAGLAETVPDGIERAAAELDSGRARDRIKLVAEASQRAKAAQPAEVAP
jgi:anthranilate phosphoribosyltransferase